MAKKGVCLARCTGELHPGPSGWIDVNPEVLELLLSGERNSVLLIDSGVLFGTFFIFSFNLAGFGDFSVNLEVVVLLKIW